MRSRTMSGAKIYQMYELQQSLIKEMPRDIVTKFQGRKKYLVGCGAYWLVNTFLVFL